MILLEAYTSSDSYIQALVVSGTYFGTALAWVSNHNAKMASAQKQLTKSNNLHNNIYVTGFLSYVYLLFKIHEY